jgi:hypothetical protein
VKMRSNVKNYIHAYLLMNNVRISAKPFTKKFLDGARWRVAETPEGRKR